MDELERQAAEQAPPVNPVLNIEPIIDDVHKQDDQQAILMEKEQRLLAEGADSEFWLVCKRILEQQIQGLRQATSIRLASHKLDLQEIGLRSVIINEIADGYQSFINRIELAKKKQMMKVADDNNEDKIEMSGEGGEL